MPFNIGPFELLLVLILALLILGPGKLPEVGSAIGKTIREFRKASTDVQDSLSVEPAKPAAAAMAGAVLGFLVAPQVIEILKAPVAGPLRFTAPGGAFFVQLRFALLIGIALASPVILYELWAFISPGLTRRERSALRPWI